MDKAAENIQHLIKWILDCYTDFCKLILCCEDDAEIFESVRNRCTVIKVDAPVTHEVSIFDLELIMIRSCSMKHPYTAYNFQNSWVMWDDIIISSFSFFS